VAQGKSLRNVLGSPRFSAGNRRFGIAETKAEAEKDGADYMVVFAEGLNISEEVEQHITKLGFNAVFLDHYLDPQDTTAHLSDLLHWSPKGQTLVAKTILEHIREMSGSKFKFSTQAHPSVPGS
jgi:hypothetical protein